MSTKAGYDNPDTVPPLRRFAGYIFVASIAMAIWAVFDPGSNALGLTVLAAFPLAAVCMVGFSRGQLQFVNSAGEITTYAFMIILVTSFVLAYRSFDVHALSWTGPALAAVVIDLCLVGLVAFFDRPNLHVRLLVSLSAICLFWGIGCANFANALLDTAPKQIFRPSIKPYSIPLGTNRGRSGGGGYARHFVVGPWGPITTTYDAVVTEFVYQRARDGRPVCVSLGRGFFDAAWYSYETCPTSP